MVVASGTPSAAPSRSPAPTPLPRPSGTLAWPTTFGQALTLGTYFSTPPFDLPLTLRIDDEGWESGHVNGEFFDLIRFEDRSHDELPRLVVGFTIPTTIRGTTDVPVADLTPGEAIDMLAARDDLTAANRASLELFGRSAEQVDLQAAVDNTGLFSGPGGTFGLGPELDARISAVALEDRLLLVVVMADPGALDAGWERALTVLGTVELLGD